MMVSRLEPILLKHRAKKSAIFSRRTLVALLSMILVEAFQTLMNGLLVKEIGKLLARLSLQVEHSSLREILMELMTC